MELNTIIEIFGLILFFTGFFGLLLKEKVLKSIISLTILEMGVIIYFLGVNFKKDTIPPVALDETTKALSADPLPQALMITTIVIGAASMTIMVVLLMIINKKYNTNMWSLLKELRKEEKK